MLKTPSSPPDSGRLMTDRQAADWLRVSQKTLYTLRCRGVVRAVRLGRSVRYTADDLQAAVAANKTGAAGGGAA